MQPGNSQTDARLDTVETAFFERENETISRRLYKTVYPANLARSFIPDEEEARGCGKVYTWGMSKNFGVAKKISNAGDDLPRAGTSAGQSHRNVEPYGASYGWSLFDIKEAARVGKPLEAMEADAARLACDNLLDSILATGDATAASVLGILNQTNTTTWTLGTKSGGGKTWALATAKEIVRDVTTGISNIMTAMKDAGGQAPFDKFDLLLTINAYLQISTMPMGDGIPMTVLQYLKANVAHLGNVSSWNKCVNAGSGGAIDRFVLYPKHPLMMGGVIAEEFTVGAPQQKNLAYVVPTYFRCGGVVVRFTFAMAYGDGG